MKRIYFVLLLAVAACSTPQPQNELARWEDRAANTEIIRDDFGVPHIYGKTDADAVFGLLYAQCEDDFNRVERNYIWAIGRLAEVEGEDELYSDLRARLFMTEEEAIANYENSPEWLKELCDAFADGKIPTIIKPRMVFAASNAHSLTQRQNKGDKYIYLNVCCNWVHET